MTVSTVDIPQPFLAAYQNSISAVRVKRLTYVSLFTALMTSLTYLGLHKIPKLSKWNFKPFQGSITSNLIFTQFVILYAAIGLHKTSNKHRVLSHFLSSIKGKTFKKEFSKKISEESQDHKDKATMIQVLNDSRYMSIQVKSTEADSEPLEPPQQEMGSYLFGLLSDKGLDEEVVIKILNQLEVSAFAEAREWCDRALKLHPFVEEPILSHGHPVKAECEISDDAIKTKCCTTFEFQTAEEKKYCSIKIEIESQVFKNKLDEITFSHSFQVEKVNKF